MSNNKKRYSKYATQVRDLLNGKRESLTICIYPSCAKKLRKKYPIKLISLSDISEETGLCLYQVEKK